MDFNYGEEDEKFRVEIRSWLEKNAKDAPKMGNHEVVTNKEASDKNFQRDRAWFRKLASGGWTGVSWPKDYAGRGASMLQQVVLHEELTRAGTYFPYIGNGLPLFGPTLIHWGTDEQKKKYLPRILSGDDVWCQGYSEPNHGSDLAALETKAVDEGDYFVVNGAKVWTSFAQYSDYVFLLVRTDPAAPKHKGISYLMVDLKTPGITIRPLVQITGAQEFNQVFYEDVRVPKANLVGEKNNGWQVAITTLMFERTSIGGNYGGTVRELADLAKRVKRNGGSAWDDAGVRQKIAEFECEGEAVKFTSYRQLTRQLKGMPPGPEGSMLKLVGTELALKMYQFAMELLGPYSQLIPQAAHSIDDGVWVHREMAARSGTIAGGSNQIQHNIIGERVLGLPKG